MRRAHAVIAGLLLGMPGVHGGCGDDESTSVDVPPPPPPTTGAAADSSTGDATTTSGGEPIGCGSSQECPDGHVCVADFSIGDPTPPSSFTCRSECVVPGAISQWCSDDASCCEGVCGVGDRADTDDSDDGLCHVPAAATGSSGDGGSSSSSDGGSSSSGDSGSSSGSSSSGSSSGSG